MLVGISNSVIDFGVLNLLMALTGVHQGALVVLFNTCSFSLAVTNSFFWNRRWTFRHNGRVRETAFSFLLVSIGGLIINDVLLALLVSHFRPPFHQSGLLWVNEAKFAAAVLSMFWNFIFYRIWVFRDRQPKLVPPEEVAEP